MLAVCIAIAFAFAAVRGFTEFPMYAAGDIEDIDNGQGVSDRQQRLSDDFTVRQVAGSHIARIAFGSCYNQLRNGLWGLVADATPDHLILLGDNVYADKRKTDALGFGFTVGFDPASPSDIRKAYDALGANKDFSRLIDVVGGWQNVYATYDDHDFGRNNAGSSFPHKHESKDIFNDFFHVSPEDRKSDGVYSSHTISVGSSSAQSVAVRIVMLDTRFSRIDRGSDGQCEILGENQWNWLKKELLVGEASSSSAPDLILLGSSIQVLPEHKGFEETWSSCAAERKRLISLIMQSPSPVIVLSGDVHSAEINQVREF